MQIRPPNGELAREKSYIKLNPDTQISVFTIIKEIKQKRDRVAEPSSQTEIHG